MEILQYYSNMYFFYYFLNIFLINRNEFLSHILQAKIKIKPQMRVKIDLKTIS